MITLSSLWERGEKIWTERQKVEAAIVLKLVTVGTDANATLNTAVALK
jgi:hypothetical protein